MPEESPAASLQGEVAISDARGGERWILAAALELPTIPSVGRGPCQYGNRSRIA